MYAIIIFSIITGLFTNYDRGLRLLQLMSLSTLLKCISLIVVLMVSVSDSLLGQLVLEVLEDHRSGHKQRDADIFHEKESSFFSYPLNFHQHQSKASRQNLTISDLPPSPGSPLEPCNTEKHINS